VWEDSEDENEEMGKEDISIERRKSKSRKNGVTLANQASVVVWFFFCQEGWYQLEPLIPAMSSLSTMAAISIMCTVGVYGMEEQEKTDWFCMVYEAAGIIANGKGKYMRRGDFEINKLFLL
jgi:hypothetical protein